MKVALVHDWYNVSAGGEKVMRAILNSFHDKSYNKTNPVTANWKKIEADKIEIFSLIDFLTDKDRDFLLNGRKVNTSFIQHFPLSKKYYRSYLPFFKRATESLDLSGFDLIVSSSAAVSKGVKKHSGQMHVCFCHTPIRYAWDMEEQYLNHLNPLLRPFKFYIRHVLSKLREWDLTNTKYVDYFLANSRFVAERIKRIYNRDAIVLYPPVDTTSFALYDKPRKEFYVTAGRLVSYKNVPLIAAAFQQMPDKKLYIIGDGPDQATVQKYCGKNVIWLGYQSEEQMVKYIQEAQAFILAAEEDFGITTVEAQSCGTPIIAYKKGGYLETVIENKTGVFFEEQSVNSIINAINRFEHIKYTFNAEQIRQNALNYTEANFNRQFVTHLEHFMHNGK